MKKILFLPLMLAFLAGAFLARSQNVSPAERYTIAFYSVENLFDTIKDPTIMDEEFTPRGSKNWTSDKYKRKQANLEKAIFELSASVKGYPTVIGMSEVENRTVLQDLISQPKLRNANYQIVHYDSPEARGIDVALLYRPDQFKYEGSFPIQTVVKGETNYRTRDILSVWGTIDGERYCFFVCHWPSRRGGQSSTDYKRMASARIIKHAADSMMRIDPKLNVVIMGDMNDNPPDRTLTEGLDATEDINNVKSNGFYNPFYEIYLKGQGSLCYGGQWELFDNILVNRRLLNNHDGSQHIVRSERSIYYGNIFGPQFMREQDGPYRGQPYRTFIGNNFHGGFSDHLPVYIHVSR